MGARVTVSSAVPTEVVAALRAERFEIVEERGELAIVGGRELPARRGGPPVLALSARGDVVAAFAAGADDVVVVPADPREVAARAEAILRRTRRPEQPLRSGGDGGCLPDDAY